MARIVALTLLVVGAFAQCALNSAGTACGNTSAYTCTPTCQLYTSSGSCAGAPASAQCVWGSQNISGIILPNTCYTTFTANVACDASITDQKLCNASLCTWDLQYCLLGNSCSAASDNFTFDCGMSAATTATQCTEAGANCVWAPSCTGGDACEIPTTQSACTATAGCYWSVDTSTLNGQSTASKGSCSSCFNDPQKKENVYLGTLAHLGQNCSVSISMMGFNLTAQGITSSAIAASTGCSAGSAFTPAGVVCTGPVKQQPTPAPSGADYIRGSCALVMLLALFQ